MPNQAKKKRARAKGDGAKKAPRGPVAPPATDRDARPSRGSSGSSDEGEGAGGEWEYGWLAPSRTTGTGGGPKSPF